MPLPNHLIVKALELRQAIRNVEPRCLRSGKYMILVWDIHGRIQRPQAQPLYFRLVIACTVNSAATFPAKRPHLVGAGAIFFQMLMPAHDDKRAGLNGRHCRKCASLGFAALFTMANRNFIKGPVVLILDTPAQTTAFQHVFLPLFIHNISGRLHANARPAQATNHAFSGATMMTDMLARAISAPTMSQVMGLISSELGILWINATILAFGRAHTRIIKYQKGAHREQRHFPIKF